jgi:hypothetical protein
VIAKRELTVAIAFTSISLFSMLRMPLNIIPTFVSVRSSHLLLGSHALTVGFPFAI